jgi:formate--tetrahydrofolate ligase
MKSDLEIAQDARLAPIGAVAAKLDIPEAALHPYGRAIAKIEFDFIESLRQRPDGKLVLVTAINPTPAGEGKTTTTIGLGDALARIGKRAMICLREPSLGPVFGRKGGATGGGYAQVVPIEAINLHFTGDFHAITAANNLLAAMIDNHIYWGNGLDIDPRRIVWRRALDVNDRALRGTVVSLGGIANGFPREDGFDIVVASEVMAVFCLARDLDDLEARLGRMIVAYTREKRPVTAADIKAAGAMTVLLKDALRPNLVQTLEGNPALVHGGPFANIAHGCNSLVATRAGLKLADYVVTEAGFGADLGAEKFFDIKCRAADLAPDACVIVATVRALKFNGGADKAALGVENLQALAVGLPNLERHIANVGKFGVPVVVAINRFASDTQAEHDLVRETVSEKFGVETIVCDHWARGSQGAEELAQRVVALADRRPKAFRPLYEDSLPLWDKVRTIATQIYGAKDIAADSAVRREFELLQQAGYGALPVCIAKTPYSFSADPDLLGAPSGYVAPIRGLRLRAGAGFVVVLLGDILTMPGLPRTPAAERIRIAGGRVAGLF